MLGLTYYGMAELSRAIASTPDNVTPMWPPDGIAMAIVLLFGHQLLPGVFLGSCLTNIGVFWPNHGSVLGQLSAIAVVIGIALGTSVGTALSITIWQRLTALPPSNPFLKLDPTVKFLIYGGLCAPIVNATVGVGLLAWFQMIPWSDYESSWFTWWIANVAGIWIISPLIICWYYWFQRNWHEQKLRGARKGLSPALRWSRQRTLEVVILAGLVLFIGHGAFWSDRPFAYMLVPLLIWSTFRFGPVGSTSVTAIVAAIAIGGTVKGYGNFVNTARTCSLADVLCQTKANLQHLQAFIVVIAFTSLILVSILEERKADADQRTTLIDELETTNQYLEERVNRRTEEIREKNQQLAHALQSLRDTQSKAIQSEKMIGLGQIVAGISHEFNNPLSVIVGNLNYMEDYTQELMQIITLYEQTYPDSTPAIQNYIDAVDLSFIRQDLPNVLHSIGTGTRRMEHIVASLRSFSRLDEAYVKAVDLHEGIDSTLHLLQYRFQDQMGRSRIMVTKDYGDLPVVECYPGELNQVFLYLLTNAIDALDEGMVVERGDRVIGNYDNGADEKMGGYWASVASDPIHPAHIHIRTEMDRDDWVVIAIADNGPGIAVETQARMFEPFFSTKPIGKGTGMGLAISYQIVTKTHAGELTCTSSLDTGTEFVIRIPRYIEDRGRNGVPLGGERG